MAAENRRGKTVLKTWNVLTAGQRSETFSDAHLPDIGDFFSKGLFLFFVFGCFASMNVYMPHAFLVLTEAIWPLIP